MPYKVFPFRSAFAAPDIQNYLMNQMVVVCTAATRPGAPPQGMVIYQTDTNTFYYCSNTTGPVWSAMNSPLLGLATSSAATTATTATVLKDGGVGDLTFTVSLANVTYRITYIARAQVAAGGLTGMDIQILDGGASSPTNASPSLGAASIFLTAGAGAGGTQVVCRAITTLSVGTHTVAAFYGRTSGAQTVSVSNATGQLRTLTVEAVPTY